MSLSNVEPPDAAAARRLRIFQAAEEMFDLLSEMVLAYDADVPDDQVDDWRARSEAIYARIVQFGPHAHAGIWIDDDTDRAISADGP